MKQKIRKPEGFIDLNRSGIILPLERSRVRILDLKIFLRYLNLTGGAILNKPSSGKQPSLTRTRPWGLNPKKFPKV
jgi:hypothetical protein